ncbi:hypothetical protein [Petrocella sp. FN5]|uniref:hypothetical protein n=1 Tax=Petrocella sp. FN5 TaxID=3032002 RepID=UPI0023DCA4CC|nr:hypothetical protein [Petrocella sp. FN5]MDF1617793.1 hypothetical protein [Petrocella sp. FN5]
MKKSVVEPKSLFQLLILLLKSLVKGIPKMILRSILVGVIVWILHAYLIVVVNNGYLKEASKAAEILGLHWNMKNATMFWGIAGWLATYFFFGRLFGKGIIKGPKYFFMSVAKTPGFLVQGFKKLGSIKGPLLFFTSITALVIGLIIESPMVLMLLVIACVLFMTSRNEGLLFLAMKLGYGDIQRWFFKNKALKHFNEGIFVAVLSGLLAGMILYVLVPYRPYSVYLLLFMIIIMAVLILLKKKGLKVNVWIIGLLSLYGFLMYETIGQAHDGGWDEYGRNFSNWWHGQGRNEALQTGTIPAIVSIIGSIIGTMTSQGVEALAPTGVSAPESTTSSQTYLPTDGRDEVEAENALDLPLGPMSEMDLKDIIDQLIEEVIGETPLGGILDIPSEIEAFIDILEEVYDVPGLIGDGISGAQDFVLTSGLIDRIFETYDSYIPNWITKAAEQTANESWDYMGVVKDLLDMNGSIPEGNPIAELMDWAGITKDALDNIGLGDNAVYAGIKSFLSNKIKGAIFDKDKQPGLIIMDMLTTIFVGGTKAGDIISPGKTIQGGANFIIDKLTDLYNGTDDVTSRLNDGKYGGVWQVANETTEVIADGVYNPDQFANDFSEVVTSDDFYDGMYQTNDELWRPAEGSWAIKRAGCYVGHQATEGLIKIADGTRQLASWLGSWV